MNLRLSHPPIADFVDDFMALWPEVGPLPQHETSSGAKKAPEKFPISLFRRQSVQLTKLPGRP
ncbi:hypothetical protein SAMN04488103_11835 [Gemmobacter aquatilis]|uniref:Uncharacterized protein n=1 Tax=Gemmobacter aquatilis TaxID=933059 RepID=A0A1H8NDK8_9RHOB|nr:hypothetical protein [Gemmobacter aquatilis]SEO27694.1 hypothetical protein SAMN04488103_11835 [Gemmobacter aquatilis]